PSGSQKRKKEDVSLASYETDVVLDSNGSWTGRIEGTMPRAKSLYHYALGESCSTAAACARFYLVLRIHFRQRGNFVELASKAINFDSVSKEERQVASQQMMRIAAIQKIEANVTRNVQKAKFHEPITETKSSNVRRRSETPRLSDSPRTRVRFGSDPYSPNSLITSAVTPSSSPSLSVASSATHRPRVILGKKASSVHSNRSVCSKSSAGGADSSSSVRTAASASSDKVDSPISSSQLVLAPSLSTSSSPEIGRQAQFQGPLPDLFTGFNGFTLRPPEKMQLAASSTKDGSLSVSTVTDVPFNDESHDYTAAGHAVNTARDDPAGALDCTDNDDDENPSFNPAHLVRGLSTTSRRKPRGKKYTKAAHRSHNRRAFERNLGTTLTDQPSDLPCISGDPHGASLTDHEGFPDFCVRICAASDSALTMSQIHCCEPRVDEAATQPSSAQACPTEIQTRQSPRNSEAQHSKLQFCDKVETEERNLDFTPQPAASHESKKTFKTYIYKQIIRHPRLGSVEVQPGHRALQCGYLIPPPCSSQDEEESSLLSRKGISLMESKSPILGRLSQSAFWHPKKRKRGLVVDEDVEERDDDKELPNKSTTLRKALSEHRARKYVFDLRARREDDARVGKVTEIPHKCDEDEDRRAVPKIRNRKKKAKKGIKCKSLVVLKSYPPLAIGSTKQ
ncbi:MAG: hypothetical protein CYPHOPRED_002771, partial [Cyphobasidiales sp. Tagirdzhanova-0007]